MRVHQQVEALHEPKHPMADALNLNLNLNLGDKGRAKRGIKIEIKIKSKIRIKRTLLCWFMVPMRVHQQVEATHELARGEWGEGTLAY